MPAEVPVPDRDIFSEHSYFAASAAF